MFAKVIINVKKVAFGNKEHTTDKKMGGSVLLRLFISYNEVCNTAYALQRIHEQDSIFKDSTMGPMIPKEMKYNLHYGKVLGDVLQLPIAGKELICLIISFNITCKLSHHKKTICMKCQSLFSEKIRKIF